MPKFEDLLAGEVCLSLINEPLDDLGSLLNERLSAREIARRRWGRTENEQEKARPNTR